MEGISLMGKKASALCSAVQDMRPGAALHLQACCQLLAAVAGSVPVVVLCLAEQTCMNYAVVAVVAGNVPDLAQMATWAVERVHEACCTSLYLAVEQEMWN